jgi:hypothetical protein
MVNLRERASLKHTPGKMHGKGREKDDAVPLLPCDALTTDATLSVGLSPTAQLHDSSVFNPTTAPPGAEPGPHLAAPPEGLYLRGRVAVHRLPIPAL